MERGAVRSGDVEIAYSVVGQGPPVLLIMGLGGRSTDWGDVFPVRLAERHRVIRFDNRGTGTSSRVPGPYTLEQLAEDAVHVLDALSIERAHVVGTSMGGMIAQLVALDHGRRVDRLVLISTHCGGTRAVLPLPHVIPHLLPAAGTPPDEIVRRRMGAIAAEGFAEANPGIIETMVRLALTQPTPMRTFRAQLDAVMRSDRYARLDDIERPTLVIHGDADPLVPHANGEILARRIPGARLETLPGCGHLPMWERPSETSDAVLAFFAS